MNMQIKDVIGDIFKHFWILQKTKYDNHKNINRQICIVFQKANSNNVKGHEFARIICE